MVGAGVETEREAGAGKEWLPGPYLLRIMFLEFTNVSFLEKAWYHFCWRGEYTWTNEKKREQTFKFFGLTCLVTNTMLRNVHF